MKQVVLCWLVVLLGGGLLGADLAWTQCSMCQTGLTQSPEGQKMAKGFNQAILLLLAFPYAVAGAFAVLLLRTRARAQGTSVRRMIRSQWGWRRVRLPWDGV